MKFIEKMKHLYIFNNQSNAAQYGIGAYIRQLIECLKGNDAFYITVVQLGAYERELKTEYDESGKIRTLFVPSINYYYNEQTSKLYCRNLLYLLSLYISDSEENIFHLNYIDETFLFELIKEKFSKSMVILTLHYLNWTFHLKGNTLRFTEIISRNEELTDAEDKQIYQEYVKDKQTFSTVDKIICLANYTKHLLLTHYAVPEEKITVIYNGLEDKAIFLTKKEIDAKKQSILIPQNEKIILYTGRMDENKGLKPLINAFRQVLSEYSKVRLILAGNGNYDFILNECNCIWNKITLTGRIEKDKLYELYQITDIGVLPSFSEQCSYSAIEIMMHGIPLVGTDATGLSEMIENGYNGYKVNIECTNESVNFMEEKLSAILLQLLNMDSQLFAQLGRQSRNMYETKYSLKIMRQNMKLAY